MPSVCTGSPENAHDSVYCNIACTAAVWNRPHTPLRSACAGLPSTLPPGTPCFTSHPGGLVPGVLKPVVLTIDGTELWLNRLDQTPVLVYTTSTTPPKWEQNAKL